MNTDQSTIISYAGVKEASDTILNCSNTMRGIFDDFSAEMETAISDDVYYGDASTSLKQRFYSLKDKFPDYVKLIKTFSDAINTAAASTAETEKKLAAEADNLAV